MPLGRAASGELARTPDPGINSCRRNVGQVIPTAIGPFGPHEALCQGAPDRGGGGTLPRLPRWPRSACPDAAGRGRVMRPAPFGSTVRTACTPLPAPEFERCRFSRPPQPLPSFMQTLSGCAGLGPAGSLLRHPLERPPGAAVFLCFCRCLSGIRGRLILRAAGIPPRAGPAFGPVQVEGPPARTGGHPFPSRRRASISKSLTSVSGS